MTAFYRILTAVYLVHSSLSTHAADTDSTATRGIHGSANTEVNYGYEAGKAEPTMWDFPHITLSAEAVLGRGWSVTAEVEYERFYTAGAWGNSFRDNFATNKLYLNKLFSPAIQVKAGIVEVPVGVTNSGGPALTIYDPESEVLLMPMTWHEGGLTLWGERGRWSYSLAALAYAATPLRRSRLLGGAARVAYSPVQDLSLALSSYWGTASRGSARLYAPDFVGTDGILYAALDGSYEANGWTVSGSAVWSSDARAHSVGMEAGYNVLAAAAAEGTELTLFGRFDGVYLPHSMALNKYTVGLNFVPWSTLILKAEYALRHESGLGTTRPLNLSIGYTYEF